MKWRGNFTHNNEEAEEAAVRNTGMKTTPCVCREWELHHLSGPYLERHVPRSSSQSIPVNRHSQARHTIVVRRQCGYSLTLEHVPHSGLLVLVTHEQHPPCSCTTHVHVNHTRTQRSRPAPPREKAIDVIPNVISSAMYSFSARCARMSNNMQLESSAPMANALLSGNILLLLAVNHRRMHAPSRY